MLQGALRYIDQEFPGCSFSEILYGQSVASAANDSIVSANHYTNGAIGIFIQSLYYVPQGITANTLTVFDQFSNLMFGFNDCITAEGIQSYFPLVSIQKGAQLSILLRSVAAVHYAFSLSYQYVYKDKKK